MNKIVILLLVVLMCLGCSSTKMAYSSKRGLMLLEYHEQPRNAKIRSPKYQKKLKKSQKKHRQDNKQMYKRSGR